MADDVRPFSNGSEADSWRARNCERCVLNKWDAFTNTDEGTCEMERAVAAGYITGTIPTTLATEYGATVRGSYCDLPRECPKLELIPTCEFIRWPKTRRASKCGRAASGEVIAHGARRAVCPRHQKRCAEMDREEQNTPTHRSTTDADTSVGSDCVVPPVGGSSFSEHLENR